MYKPSIDQLKEAKKIYDEVIFQYVLRPQKVREAFELLFGYPPNTLKQAKIKVAAFFTYQFKPEMLEEPALGEISQSNKDTDLNSASSDKTETVFPDDNVTLSVPGPQSHDERITIMQEAAAVDEVLSQPQGVIVPGEKPKRTRKKKSEEDTNVNAS